MTLTRGVFCLVPCTCCYCPQNELSNLTKRHKLRTAEEAKALWEVAQTFTTKAAKERLFKSHGLRDVEVNF